MKRPPILRSVWPLLLLLVAVCNTRGERLPIKIYTSADGLGSSFIDFLMRDQRGFMWFCTRDGLSRFDGSRFVTYSVGDKQAPPGIESLYQTRDGVYWITTTRGLYRFTAEAMPQPNQNTGDRPFLNAEYVSPARGPLLEDRNGTLWYADNDLYRVKQQDGKFVFEPMNLNIPASPTRRFEAFQIREAPDGSLWLNTSVGLVRRLPDGRLTLYHHETPVRVGLASLVIEPNGRVWVLWRNDFYVINPAPIQSISKEPAVAIKQLLPDSIHVSEPRTPVQLPTKPDEIIQLTNLQRNVLTGRLYQSADQHLWLIADETLIEFDGKTFHSYGRAQGLPAGMGEMAEDSAGNLWIGGRTALVRLDRRGLVTYQESDGLGSKNIFSIREDRDGTMYFINGDYFISRFDGEHFQTSRANVAADARALWTSRAAFLSSANEWWVLTSTKLYRFAAGDLNHPLATYDSHDQFKADEMYQMFEDSHGNIWISQQPSGAENFGLYRLKKGEQTFQRFAQGDGLPAGKSAAGFAEDKYGNLWFGFYEGGLVRFANERFTFFSDSDGLPLGVILELLIDHEGRLWMTSSYAGLTRIDDTSAAKPRFISFGTEQGLSSNNTRSITEDKQGNIYVGTVRGVDQISPDLSHIRHYSVTDGLAADFVVDAHCDRNGVLWFATTNGLSRMIPSAGEKHPAPPVWLGGLRIAGEKQPISELGQTEVNQGELKYTQNNFQIDFFGLDFHAGANLRYQFMLEGADSKWSPLTEQRTVTYANLRPGSYRFLVRAVNSDGTQSERPAVLSFRILSPIWLRWWFLTLVALLVIGLLYVIYRYRMARLREVNAALAEANRAEEDLSRTRAERLIELARVRTRIATDLHDDIGASLTQIAILSEVARQQNMQGNGASLDPLNRIVNVSNELVETMSDIVWAINPEKDRLQDLIQRMRRFASDLLTAKGVHFDFNTPSYVLEIPLGANARREVFLIFKESLTNIAKHAAATEVKIDFDISQDDLSLSITDNGHGFDLEQSGPALTAWEKGGHGIFSMKKRAAELNGKLDIKSEVGRGTTITVRLPLDVAARHARVATTQMGGDNGGWRA